jgi:hypothetical protein
VIMRSRSIATALSFVVTVIVAMGVGAAPALAETHPFLEPLGGILSPDTFTSPNGIAVDESTGDVYVAQIGTSEQQTVSIQGGPEGGGFTLEFKGKKTPALSVSGTSAPSAEAVQTALRELSTIGPVNNSNVTVTEEGALPGTVTYTVSFQGELATVSLPQLVCDGSALTGGTSPACTVATTVPGVDSKVSKLDANGKPIESWGTKGTLDGGTTAAGSFAVPNAPGTPAAIAVDNSTNPSDPSAGDLYVLDAGHQVIDKFAPSGAYLGQIADLGQVTGAEAYLSKAEMLGLGVDASGNVRVELSEGSNLWIAVFDNSEPNDFVRLLTPSRGIGGGQDHGFAVDAVGDSYVLAEGCGCVEKFSPNLEFLGQVDSNSQDVAAAVDQTTGHVYIDDQSYVDEWDTGEMNGVFVGAKGEESTPGALVSPSFGSLQLAPLLSGQGGIAVNGANGDVYVSNPVDEKVDVFATSVPRVTAGAPANVTKTSATLQGTVDPGGAPVTSCEFEYGAETPYSQKVACTQTLAQIGSGSSPVAVSADVSGLQPGTLYHFRLDAGNSEGTSPSSGLFPTEGPGFGVKSLAVSFENENGTPDTQAGSHPYKMSTSVVFNSTVLPDKPNGHSAYVTVPDGNFKDVIVNTPPGLIADPNATLKKCPLKEIESEKEGGECPAESAVGYLEAEYYSVGGSGHTDAIETVNEPVYDMVPPAGVAMQLGTHVKIANAFIDLGVPAGGDYGGRATVTNASTLVPVVRTKLTLCGVYAHLVNEKVICEVEKVSSAPLLTLPTACNGPLTSTVSADSYQNPGQFAGASAVTLNAAGTPGGMTGCAHLVFPPTISVSPDISDASTSTGLTVGVHVPQIAALNPGGLAESALRNTTVTLPEGVALNPAGANGLEACLEGLIGFTGSEEFNPTFEPGNKTATFTPELPEPLQPGTNFCPNGSKVGTVKIETPLLENELEGAVYLASQEENPFGSLVAMYLVAEDPVSGTLIKLTGEVHLSETGQIITTFKNTPELPFENLALHFFGGERAPLTTPSRCGTYTTQASFVPWDGNGPVNTSASFQIEHGPNGGPCPGASLPFNPSLTVGTTNNQAGGFTLFTMTMSHEDGNQPLQGIQLHMPPGLLGMLSAVTPCEEVAANAGTCGEASKIGEVTTSVGVGGDPYTVTGGRVYITGPYHGAPYGLSIVEPAKAGPFDLEDTATKRPACDCLVVRAKIEVNPLTAALTVTANSGSEADAIPTIIEGIPLQIKHVNVTINRNGFTFNPTDCDKLGVTGTLTSAEGAFSTLSVPFQVTNCAALAFKPKFAASTSAHNSRTGGASLETTVIYPGTPQGSEVNIAKVKVSLPAKLPARLTTLQKACPEQTFAANPASCPAPARVGEATTSTPVLPNPLSGPAYFVSHGGEAFPSLIVVLQGEGITVDLEGTTFISKKGITTSTFKSVPDVPVSTFELVLPKGPHSALAANGNLCKGSLALPTEFLGQNGALIKQSTKITVTGCPKKHKAKKKAKQHKSVKKGAKHH